MSVFCSSLEKEVSQYSFTRAQKVFPGGVNSPVRACRSVRVNPPVVSRAYGHTIVDTNDKEWIDFCCSWGSLIHGHAYEGIRLSVSEALALGTSYGLTSCQEIRFAELILSDPEFSQSQVRFMSSGTEATMTAVRLARGVTRRNIIVKCEGCYHGHSDVFMKGVSIEELLSGKVDAGFFDGALPLVTVRYNDAEGLKACIELLRERVAAIIVEPIAANMGLIPLNRDFIEEINRSCRVYGCLFIADEVVTGYRLKVGGIASSLGLHPDISVFGKIIGGGFPVSAIVAKREYMEHLSPQGKVFQAGTLSGNPIAMVAGYASVKACLEPHFYSNLATLSSSFIEPIKTLIEGQSLPVQLVHEGSMFGFFFTEFPVKNMAMASSCDMDRFALFYQKLFEQGIYLSPSPLEVNFISTAHSQEILEKVRERICHVLIQIFDY